MCGSRRLVASTMDAGLSMFSIRNIWFSQEQGCGSGIVVLAIARVAEVDRYARPDLDWFLYSFGVGMISVLPASATLKRVSASGEQIKERSMPMKRSDYHGGFAGRGMLEAYPRKA